MEVLDEASCEILGLLFPNCGIGVSVARIEDAGVDALKHGRNLEVEERDLLGRSLVDGAGEDGIDDSAGVADGDALAGAVPAGVHQIREAERRMRRRKGR